MTLSALLEQRIQEFGVAVASFESDAGTYEEACQRQEVAIAALRSQIEEERRAAVEQVRLPCSVCLGKPLASGRPCICKGTGTEWAETQGLREALYDVREELEQVTSACVKWQDKALATETRLHGARKLLERALPWIPSDPGYSDAPPLRADIDAYLAAPPAQPPRVTAEMVREASNFGWSVVEFDGYQKIADNLNARLSAEREPPDIEAHPKYHVRSGHVFPKDGSACVLCEAEREPGEAGTKHG